MAERVLHCWADKHSTDGLVVGSEEWIEVVVAREAEQSATCLLPADHAGPHEWVPDSEITVTFKDAAGEGAGG